MMAQSPRLIRSDLASMGFTIYFGAVVTKSAIGFQRNLSGRHSGLLS